MTQKDETDWQAVARQQKQFLDYDKECELVCKGEHDEVISKNE